MFTTTYKKLMMLILTMLVSVGSFAKVEINGLYYELDDETKKASVAPKQGGNYHTPIITIPSTVTYEGTTYKVTSIGEYAFDGCYDLTAITIPESVTSIGGSAFSNCIGLTTITIPKSVKKIGDGAFYYSGIESITIPKSVKNIGGSILTGCNNLGSIIVESGNTVYDSRDNSNAIIKTATNTMIAGCKNTIIPNSVTSIDQNTFIYCSTLTSINIPNSITKIPDHAFGACWDLQSVTISNSVKEIEEGAFNCCYALTSINIPESVTNIGIGTFYNCKSLKSITIPNTIKSIKETTFRDCKDLESVTIGNSVKSIEGGAFAYCRSLKSIIIPNSVTTIGMQVFEGCSNLQSITLGSSIEKIDSWAFKDCNAITSITILATTPPQIEGGSFPIYGTLHVLPGCKAAYKEHFEWQKFKIVEDAVITPEIVTDMINVIGQVEDTETCKSKIDAARIAYSTLTQEQQALVKNYNILIEAEKDYKQVTTIFNINAETTKKEGKYLVNGKIMIVKNGKTYKLNGVSK